MYVTGLNRPNTGEDDDDDDDMMMMTGDSSGGCDDYNDESRLCIVTTMP
jgi:hypothetical protein